MHSSLKCILLTNQNLDSAYFRTLNAIAGPPALLILEGPLHGSPLEQRILAPQRGVLFYLWYLVANVVFLSRFIPPDSEKPARPLHVPSHQSQRSAVSLL